MDNTEVVPMEQEAPIGQEVQQDSKAPADPKLEKESQAYITGLMKILHSKETSPKIMEILKSAPPEQAVPQVALMVNQQMEDAARAKGKPPSLEVLLGAGIYLTQDLLEMGNAAGIFQIEGEEAAGEIIKSTLQTYIEKGLKDKTIDPVELQEKVQPLLDEAGMGQGMEAASANGIPEKPDQMTAMEQYASKREQKAGMMRGGA